MADIGGLFPATSMPDRDWWAVLWPDPLATLCALGIAPGMTVVDLCCGDGYFTAPLARLLGGRVHALDLDPAMLAAARAEADRQGVAVLGWHQGDARDLDRIVPGGADYVLIANTFHGVPDQATLAAAVVRVLVPGGRFGIVNWHPRPREATTVLGKPRGPKTEMRMAPATVAAVVEPAGFVLERETELPPFHYGVVFRKG
jgi:ubiquinone/menaquinone biosynthesis C-methylase UbiE